MTVRPIENVSIKGFEGHSTNEACLSADWTPKAEACLRRKYVGHVFQFWTHKQTLTYLCAPNQA